MPSEENPRRYWLPLAAALLLTLGLGFAFGWGLASSPPATDTTSPQVFVSAPVRGPADGEIITLPDAPLLELRLELAERNALGPFDVHLRQLPEGRAWILEGVPPEDASQIESSTSLHPHLTLRLPTAELTPGLYHLKVWGQPPPGASQQELAGEKGQLVGVVDLRIRDNVQSKSAQNKSTQSRSRP
ncbi:MAG: hypothetical protein AAGD01_13310 [Acidobacteriota bacterium]